MDPISQAVAALSQGGVVAYPTEGVWGLGCDPDNERALMSLIALKGRASDKGLILIAGSIVQLTAWLVDLQAGQRARLEASWPGFNTWLIPDNGRAHALLRGEHPTLAVRVTDHPLVQQLCAAWGGPLVSTSANRAGEPPAMSATAVREAFGGSADVLYEDVLYGDGPRVDYILDGALGGYDRPSTIRDLLTDRLVRA